MKLPRPELRALVAGRAAARRRPPAMADSTARALVLAEAQGLGSHGLSRVAQYATHLRNGRVNGAAVPQVLRRKGGALLVDAREGLAFPACELAVREAVAAAREQGVAFAGVVQQPPLRRGRRPPAPGGCGGHGRPGLRQFAGGDAGGRRPAPDLRHQPGGRGVPRAGADPLMIDLSLSEVARGKVMVAAKEGKPIPPGWALDAEGRPTTDPQAGLAGSMLPIGAVSSPKGAMLALVVELLVTAVIGANFGFEASSFFVDEGNRPRIGQAFIVIDPGALAGATLPRPHRGAGGRDAEATRACACPARAARRCAARPRPRASRCPTRC
jgi:(2R)-3-sulfolactate dehydrogenase (NADP+)